jgi:GxxExxY protein
METEAPTKTDEGRRRGKHDDLTERIIGVFYEVYSELGYGFLESVYAEAMRVALAASGFQVHAEVPINVFFRGTVIGRFRADLVVNEEVLVELKTCDALVRQHESQTLNYLRATRIEVALLMNFGPEPRFKRLIMDNEKKMGRSAFIGVTPLLGGGMA